MKYEDNLPSLRLNGKALEELEKIIIKSIDKKTKFKQKIEIKYNGWSKSYNSASELLEDANRPDSIKEIDWDVKASEGTIWIYGHGNYPTRIKIEGDNKWVKAIKQDLYEFIKKYKSLSGKIANNFLFIFITICVGVLIVSRGLFLENMTNKILFIFIGFLFSLFGIIQLFELKYYIPYFLLEFKENKNRKIIEQIAIALISSSIFYVIIYYLQIIL